MGNLYDTLTACLTDQLIQAVLSAARKKDGPSRVKIRPVLHKGTLFFQMCIRDRLKSGLPYIGLQANWQQIITGLILILAVFIDVIKNRKLA